MKKGHFHFIKVDFLCLNSTRQKNETKKNCIMLIKLYFQLFNLPYSPKRRFFNVLRFLLLSLSSLIRKLEDFFAFPLYIFFCSFTTATTICSENISSSSANQQIVSFQLLMVMDV
ncbi:hypothetical protein ACKWTF_011898 [Chironomus riparius]